MIRVEPATVEHARAMAPYLEIFGCGPLPLDERVKRLVAHVRASENCFVWLDEEEPVAICGVVPRSIVSGIGAVWLLTTPAAKRSPRIFWRASKAIVLYLQHAYPRLEGRVDVSFAASVRWLKRLGFAVHNEPFEHEGRTFFPFAMER